MLAELSAKRLQLLKEAIPRVARVAVLWNPGTPWHAAALQDVKRPALSSSIELSGVSVQKPEHFELVINLKSAGALRLSIPQSVLLRADELIK